MSRDIQDLQCSVTTLCDKISIVTTLCDKTTSAVDTNADVDPCNFWLSVGSPISPDVRAGGGRGANILILSLVIKRKVVQNVNRMSENIMSVCQYEYVSMSICQNATFQLRYQNESCSKCHKDVRQSVCHYALCQYVKMSMLINSASTKDSLNVEVRR